MAGRYLITGVQLGMLIGINDIEERKSLADTIERCQYVGCSKKSIAVDVTNVRKLHKEE